MISMKSIMNTTHSIAFNSESNNLLRFTKDITPKEKKSEKLVAINPIDKVHPKCDCINESFVNGIRDHFLCSFNLDNPQIINYLPPQRQNYIKKITTDRLGLIRLYIVNSDTMPVDFSGETLTFTIQLIKI